MEWMCYKNIIARKSINKLDIIFSCLVLIVCLLVDSSWVHLSKIDDSQYINANHIYVSTIVHVIIIFDSSL